VNVKSLHDIFGLKFQDNYIDVVLTNEPRLSFCDAKDILKTAGVNFHTKESELGIYVKDRHGITINTIFVNGSNPERFRGMTIRNLYVNKNINNLKQIKEQLYPIAKYIIEKD
jgi:hypothetical protein